MLCLFNRERSVLVQHRQQAPDFKGMECALLFGGVSRGALVGDWGLGGGTSGRPFKRFTGTGMVDWEVTCRRREHHRQ